MTKYSLTAKIGQGAYGVVLKGRNEKVSFRRRIAIPVKLSDKCDFAISL